MDDRLIMARPLPIPGMGASLGVVGDGEARLAKEKKLRKACADFESLFIYQMFKTMRNTVPPGGLLGNRAGKDVYEMMMDQKVSEELAKKGGMGLQDVLFNQLSNKAK